MSCTVKMKHNNDAAVSLSNLKLQMLSEELDSRDHSMLREVFEDNNEVRSFFRK